MQTPDTIEQLNNTSKTTGSQMLEMLALSVSIGFVLGLVSGLIPGIHTNNFALILLALSPAISEMGFSNIDIAAIILANSIAHTLLYVL